MRIFDPRLLRDILHRHGRHLCGFRGDRVVTFQVREFAALIFVESEQDFALVGGQQVRIVEVGSDLLQGYIFEVYRVLGEIGLVGEVFRGPGFLVHVQVEWVFPNLEVLPQVHRLDASSSFRFEFFEKRIQVGVPECILTLPSSQARFFLFDVRLLKKRVLRLQALLFLL